MCLLFRFPALSVLNDSNRLLGVNCVQDPHLFLVKSNLITKFTTQNHLKSSVLPKTVPFFSRFLLVKPESLLVKSAGARWGPRREALGLLHVASEERLEADRVPWKKLLEEVIFPTIIRLLYKY